jgi:2-isopropylmalate synthase
MRQEGEAYSLAGFDIEAGSGRTPFAKVTVSLPGGQTGEGSFTGDGPVEAFFSALNVACNREGRLKEYHVSAVTAGRDALAEVTVVLELDGVQATGQGVSPDTMEASGRAYLRALSNAVGLIDAGEKTDHRVPAEASQPATA